MKFFIPAAARTIGEDSPRQSIKPAAEEESKAVPSAKSAISGGSCPERDKAPQTASKGTKAAANTTPESLRNIFAFRKAIVGCSDIYLQNPRPPASRDPPRGDCPGRQYYLAIAFR